MRVPALVIAMLLANGAAFAKGGKGDGKPTTIEGALADAESALEAGRLGDAMSESEKLQKTHGLTKKSATGSTSSSRAAICSPANMTRRRSCSRA